MNKITFSTTRTFATDMLYFTYIIEGYKHKYLGNWKIMAKENAVMANLEKH